ncbi:hypothetical protein O3P69_011122 [Scylla paramamosain]|uniref:Uncharacterized protein n=1 Tax=Scylla paramamosain TaxID=85552 RepID=A0AAW0SSM0_SCYPA
MIHTPTPHAALRHTPHSTHRTASCLHPEGAAPTSASRRGAGGTHREDAPPVLTSIKTQDCPGALLTRGQSGPLCATCGPRSHGAGESGRGGEGVRAAGVRASLAVGAAKVQQPPFGTCRAAVARGSRLTTATTTTSSTTTTTTTNTTTATTLTAACTELGGAGRGHGGYPMPGGARREAGGTVRRRSSGRRGDPRGCGGASVVVVVVVVEHVLLSAPPPATPPLARRVYQSIRCLASAMQ